MVVRPATPLSSNGKHAVLVVSALKAHEPANGTWQDEDEESLTMFLRKERCRLKARNLIVIGGSAGGVEALLGLVPQLPKDLDAAVCVVIHFPADSPSLLPQLLQRRTDLVVDQATQSASLEAGHIYVAPPDWHLLINDHACLLSHGPREHGYRPSIDALFRTAAETFGRATVGVVLSGGLDDGSAGLRHIRLLGGKCVVQDPSDAAFPSMPTNAMLHVSVDRSVPIHEMGEALCELVDQLHQEVKVTSNANIPANPGKEIDPLNSSMLKPPIPAHELNRQNVNELLVLRCPDCGGVLQETIEEGLPAYRCRVGHNFSLLSLLEAQGMALEQELWSAFNGLLERIDLCRRLIEKAKDAHQHDLEGEFAKKAEDAKIAADMLREFLLRGSLFRPMPQNSATGDLAS